ncbi:hypothetical protein QRD43_14065 [Pelomonas sp. APW6]|uniref:ATP synthase subunit I n=2 Tax=Roseateles subflavus TaxID=3053353 RepID=A0ABT7LJJ7_9BURK|nr:hypothetical protein [Pelomonas sp. APW6]
MSKDPAADPSEGNAVHDTPQLFRYLGWMTLAQALVTAWLAPVFLELVRLGAVNVLTLLAAVLGCATLYATVLRAVMSGTSGKKAFGAAAVLLGLSCWKWGVPFLMALMGYGALLAVGGLRLSVLREEHLSAPSASDVRAAGLDGAPLQE